MEMFGRAHWAQKFNMSVQETVQRCGRPEARDWPSGEALRGAARHEPNGPSYLHRRVS